MLRSYETKIYTDNFSSKEREETVINKQGLLPMKCECNNENVDIVLLEFRVYTLIHKIQMVSEVSWSTVIYAVIADE